MTERKWTPGPWRVGPVDDTRVEDADGNEVAQIDGDYNQPETWPLMEANARLIAAAPDLYEALEITIGYIEWMIEDGCKQCGGDCSSANPPVQYCPIRIMRSDLDTARAALTKAEGKRK